MWLALIETYAETASFRLPETHTFHKTLPLPPYTSCVGLLGASLGLPLPDAYAWVEEHGVQIGVAGRDRGWFKDLWKYQKVKTDQVISDVLLREYRVDLTCQFVYAVEDRETAEAIADAFRKPAYPLTAGHSDSLLIVRSSTVAERDPVPLDCLSFCVVPGDLSSRYRVPENLLTELPLTATIRAPQVVSLPTAFVFEGDRRDVITRETFTFVGHPIELNEPMSGFLCNERTVVLR